MLVSGTPAHRLPVRTHCKKPVSTRRTSLSTRCCQQPFSWIGMSKNSRGRSLWDYEIRRSTVSSKGASRSWDSFSICRVSNTESHRGTQIGGNVFTCRFEVVLQSSLSTRFPRDGNSVKRPHPQLRGENQEAKCGQTVTKKRQLLFLSNQPLCLSKWMLRSQKERGRTPSHLDTEHPCLGFEELC